MPEDFESYYRNTIQSQPDVFDTSIGKAQWQAWEKDKMAGCPPDRPYRGRTGECANKPDDCPDGSHVVGNDAQGNARCVPDSAGQGGMGAAGGYGAPARPPRPVTQGAAGTLTYTGNPLTDALLYQFNTGQSLQTGAPNIFSGFNPEAKTPLGKVLSGGGLLWTEAGAPTPWGAAAGGRRLGRQGLHGGLAAQAANMPSLTPGGPMPAPTMPIPGMQTGVGMNVPGGFLQDALINRFRMPNSNAGLWRM